jgi:hypothetical protein
MSPDLRIGGGATDETLRIARDVLEHRGASWRANRNAAMLIAADAPAIAKARASARTLAALRDLKDDLHRLGRFNAEQREQLSRRLVAAEERLPQQLAMAYRHLILLGEGNGNGAKLDHIDLGPARVDATIGGRVVGYLREADRLVESSLAPAALLAERFGLLPAGTDSIELDALLGYFYRFPRLPKLSSPQVLRQSLSQGVKQQLFGLASGSAWDADDAVLRYGQPVDPSEILFQPGTWLVRAAAVQRLIDSRTPVPKTAEPPEDEPAPPATSTTEARPVREPTTETSQSSLTAALAHVRIRIEEIPARKVRDVVKVAVLPLAAASSDVTIELVITAEGGLHGIPRDTLDLVVLEGLRQLGLPDVTVTVVGDERAGADQ